MEKEIKFKRIYFVLISIILFILSILLIFLISPTLTIKTSIYQIDLKINLEIPPLIALIGGDLSSLEINDSFINTYLIETFVKNETIYIDYITLIGLAISLIGLILLIILWNKKYYPLIGSFLLLIGAIIVSLEGISFTFLNEDFLSETISIFGLNIYLKGEIFALGGILSALALFLIFLLSLIKVYIYYINIKGKKKNS